ncbi:MAG: UDP-N-acetylmuramoyl-L-alanine--D-glutamate ligase [Gammaproteobacteria bacterium]|nr:UDP-N-acetylmuramoyl-L-alanine--D-glutamate ligase [Gammaproteobacteria bacterium]
MKERVAVLGFGITGQSVARYLLGAGIEPVVLDTRSPREVSDEFEEIEIHWQQNRWRDFGVSKVVLSPGLSMKACVVQGARSAGIPLSSDIDIFMQAVNVPVVGITGTNGKSTVTALLGHMLEHKGVDVGVGGNLGEAALDLISDNRDCYVLELSSFQLERSQLHEYQVGCVLNISEDHLDQHGDMQSYTRSKQRIYQHAKSAVYNRQDINTLPVVGEMVSFGLDVPPTANDWGVVENDSHRWIFCGSEKVCEPANLKLKGEHNELNVMAACALARKWLALDEMAAALACFDGLPHRFELVARVGEVVFINDSKATNLGAAVAALESLPRENNVLLIAGGDAKGVDLTPLGLAMKGRVKYLATLGKDAGVIEIIADHLAVTYERCGSIEEATSVCYRYAQGGDVVLLSPACASIDMFANYQERGSRFAHAAVDLVQP